VTHREQDVASDDDADRSMVVNFRSMQHGYATYASGIETAQSFGSICHPAGTSDVLRTIIPDATIMHNISATRKRFMILGTSMKKFDSSTSFLVAPHVMS
jgi:hypothetical protein